MADLGPYGDEDRLPPGVYAQFNRSPINNQHFRTMPLLTLFLSVRGNAQKEAYLCHPFVKHHVASDEPGMCGYQNIRNQLSYLFDINMILDPVPSIATIQKWIVNGWWLDPAKFPDQGAYRRRLINTRKWIGPQEAQACFDWLSIPSERVIYGQDEHQRLLDNVEKYFSTAKALTSRSWPVHQTAKPPIFFQAFGHSYTIVGIEILLDGTRNLIVLDPDIDPQRLIKRQHYLQDPEGTLSPYMLHKEQLRQMGTYGFETLT
jgi:hypothetical protein